MSGVEFAPKYTHKVYGIGMAYIEHKGDMYNITLDVDPASESITCLPEEVQADYKAAYESNRKWVDGSMREVK